MSFLSRILPGSSTSPKDERLQRQEMVERLCSSLLNATLLEDRQAAAQTLKNIAKQCQLEIGSIGLPHLLTALKRDCEDDELARSILETLINVCSQHQLASPNNTNMPSERTISPSPNHLHQQFCEILLKDAQAVETILACLSHGNLYVQYDVLQLLALLQEQLPERLPSALLATPSSLSHLLDLLESESEVLQNEAILLLQGLTRSNAEIQRIVVFGNIFERLFDLMIAGGGVFEGEMLIEDSFKVIHSLLRHNPSGQNYLRESLCFCKLAQIITPPKGGNSNVEEAIWSPQLCRNLMAAYEVIIIMTERENPKLSVTQEALLRIGVLQPTFQVALSPSTSDELRAKVQTIFGRHICPAIGRPHPIPAVLAVITFAFGHHSFPTRLEAVNVIGSYLSGNPDGQLVIAATFKSPTLDRTPGMLDDQSAGSMIIDGLVDLEACRRDPQHVWFSSLLMAHVLRENDQCKMLAMRHKEDSAGRERDGGALSSLPILDDALVLFERLALQLQDASRDQIFAQATAGYLILLATWLHDFSPAVSAFLSEGSNVQFLIELISRTLTGESFMQGCAAYIYGLCVLFHDGSTGPFSRAALIEIVKSRIGIDVYTARLLRLRDMINTLLAGDGGFAQAGAKIPVDRAFAVAFLASYDHVLRVTTEREPKSIPSSPYFSRREIGVECDIMAGQIPTNHEQSTGSNADAYTGATLSFEMQSLQSQLGDLQGQLEVKDRMIEQLKKDPQTVRDEPSNGLLVKNLESKLAYMVGENERLQKLAAAYSTQLLQIEKEHEDLLIILASYDSELKQLRQHLALAEQQNSTANHSDIELSTTPPGPMQPAGLGPLPATSISSVPLLIVPQGTTNRTSYSDGVSPPSTEVNSPPLSPRKPTHPITHDV